MNMSELAQKMLEWEELVKQANALEEEIKAAVLEIGKTQTVGNVRASYSGGRNTYDYETPAKTADAELIQKYTITETVTSTDWRAICKDADIEPLIVKTSPPSIGVKLLS